MTDPTRFPRDGDFPSQDPETHRLEALHALGVLDTPPEERFDRLIRLTARHFRVPIALISLVDEHRCFLKSRTGIEISEVPREITFCNQAIKAEGVFVVEDAHADPRFRDNPLVTGEPFIRLYAGQPLFAHDGEMLGFLCIIDTEPRQLSEIELESLADFAHLVEHELNVTRERRAVRADIEDLRLEVKELGSTLTTRTEDAKEKVRQNARLVVERQAERRRADSNQALAALLLEGTHYGVFGVDLEGRITFINPTASRMNGYGPEELVGRHMHHALHHSHADGTPMPVDECRILHTVRSGQGTHVEGEVFWRKDGTSFPVAYSTTPIMNGSQVSGAICIYNRVTAIASLEDASGSVNARQSRSGSTSR